MSVSVSPWPGRSSLSGLVRDVGGMYGARGSRLGAVCVAPPSLAFAHYGGLTAASSVCAWRLRPNRCVHHFLLWERCAVVSCMFVCGWRLCSFAQVAPGIFLHRTCGTCACTCLGGRTCRFIRQLGRCARAFLSLPLVGCSCRMHPQEIAMHGGHKEAELQTSHVDESWADARQLQVCSLCLGSHLLQCACDGFVIRLGQG
jgi:hypothetical protein